jgi:hypothetical protein
MLLLHEPGSRYTLAKADRCSYRKPKHLVGEGQPVDCFRVITDFCRLVCYASVELRPARAALVAEILMLRELNVLHRQAPKRVSQTSTRFLPGSIGSCWMP